MLNLLPTAIEAISGFLLGNLTAILIATVFVHKKTMEEAFFPVVVVVNTIPVVAKAPILVLLLGNGMEPKIAIAALICFFPTLVNMVRGLESVNPQAMELMRVLSASKREVFFKLRLYNSLPYLFSALKISASTSVIGAIVGEWIGSTYGIGALIIQAMYNFDSAMLYATVIVGSVFSVVFFLAISFAERHGRALAGAGRALKEPAMTGPHRGSPRLRPRGGAHATCWWSAAGRRASPPRSRRSARAARSP